MALNPIYLSEHTGPELDAAINKVKTALQPKDLTDALKGLTKADTPVEGEYVSAVSQQDGIIEVKRATLPSVQPYDDSEIRQEIRDINTTIDGMTVESGASADTYVYEVTQSKGKIVVTYKSFPPQSEGNVYTFAEGVTNGTISVTKNSDAPQEVSVHGLKGAAFKDASAFEQAGAIQTAIGTLETETISPINTKLAEVQQAQESLSAQLTSNAEAIAGVKEVIPTSASTTNKLVDANTLNDTIEKQAARFITPTAEGGQYASFAVLQSATTWYHAGQEITALTNHDYAIFLKEEGGITYQYRATWEDGVWSEQYKVGSALTADQQAAIDSGITAEKVAQIGATATDITALQNKVTTLETLVNSMAEFFKKNDGTYILPAEGGLLFVEPETASGTNS